MQHIKKFQWSSAYYETRNICFKKYISRNSLIVLGEEMLGNFRRVVHVFCRFKQEDYNKLRVICFFNVYCTANMLLAIYLRNIFHAICFMSVRPA